MLNQADAGSKWQSQEAARMEAMAPPEKKEQPKKAAPAAAAGKAPADEDENGGLPPPKKAVAAAKVAPPKKAAEPARAAMGGGGNFWVSADSDDCQGLDVGVCCYYTCSAAVLGTLALTLRLSSAALRLSRHVLRPSVFPPLLVGPGGRVLSACVLR